jgi:hypothetical protein
VAGSNFNKNWNGVPICNGIGLRGNAGYDVAINFVGGVGPVVRVAYKSLNLDTNAYGVIVAECDVASSNSACRDIAFIDPLDSNGAATHALFGTIGTAIDPSSGNPAWKLMWQQTRHRADDGSNTACDMAIFSVDLDASGNQFGANQETQFQTPCMRADGYWGDYDSHLPTDQRTSSDYPFFIRSFTDSTDGNGNSQCLTQETWRGNPVAVSQLYSPW